MATYVLMTKLAPELMQDVKHREAIGRNWIQLIQEKCPEVKFVGHWALLGQYDFMDIYEAPDGETAAKVAMITQAQGAVSAETLAAIPYPRFLELMDEIA